MDNSKRLAEWRKRNKGIDASVRETNPRSVAEGIEGSVTEKKKHSTDDLDAKRRWTEELLPTTEDLAARRASNAENAYREGRIRLVKVAVFALLPIVMGIAYLGALAPQFFASESAFTVTSATDDGNAPSGGLAAMGGIGFTDGYRVKKFLLSGEALAELDRQAGFLNHFGSVEASEALSFYRKRISLTIDQQEKIITLVVDAKSASDSVRFANVLLKLGQAKVRAISKQIDQDQLAVLEDEEQEARTRLTSAMRELQTVQIARSEIDPRKSAESIFSIITQIETDLSEQEAQRAALLSNGLNQSPLLPRINSRIAALQSQIERQENRLVAASSSDTVQRSIALYEAAIARKEAAEAALEAARETLDRARLRGLDHRKYLIVIARPMLPASPETSRLFYVLLGLGGLLTLYILANLWGLYHLYRSHE